MFIKDMRALDDIAQSLRPSNNLVYRLQVAFYRLFKVTFMLVLFQGKGKSSMLKHEEKKQYFK